MSIELASQLWNGLKSSIDNSDLPDAADFLVNTLIDNDFDPSEIKQEFKRDSIVMDALRYYTENLEDEEEDEYDDQEDIDDY